MKAPVRRKIFWCRGRRTLVGMLARVGFPALKVGLFGNVCCRSNMKSSIRISGKNKSESGALALLHPEGKQGPEWCWSRWTHTFNPHTVFQVAPEKWGGDCRVSRLPYNTAILRRLAGTGKSSSPAATATGVTNWHKSRLETNYLLNTAIHRYLLKTVLT